MGLHKLTAGSGYTYLTRQVAALDATSRGQGDLGTYYSERGEAPGVWMGRGRSGVPDFRYPEPVSEAQMRSLFGAGRHPDAENIEHRLRSTGASEGEVDRATSLGRAFPVFEAPNAFRARCAAGYREFNTARGLPAVARVPAPERARIRTALARTMFAETHGRAPADARELSGFLARASRPASMAVAGYDLTFSPVKSVSTLWAIAPRQVAEVIEGAHRDAVAGTLAWLENHATFSREGAGGVRQVDVRGLIAAAFTHRDSRAGDPDLHTHVAVANKVQTVDGRWLSLDGRALFKNKVAASERYNTRLEALLIGRLGVTFADRPAPDPGKRPVREIVGVDGQLPRHWSSRRTAIQTRTAVLATGFQVVHGRPPTPVEALALGQQATLETRAAKHEPRSHGEQRNVWRAEATAVLGGQEQLDGYLARALGPARGRVTPVVAGGDIGVTAAAVLETVQAERASWQQNHVRAEAERRARAAGVRLAEVDGFVDDVVTHVLSKLSVGLGAVEPVVEPAGLRRADGTSVYMLAGSRRYSSAAILTAEQQVLDAAGRTDGRTVPTNVVAVALLERAANGVALNSGQARMVIELATSGARVQLALAPAGTGKTTALRALAHAWTAGGGSVVGLAPSAAAAAVLRGELNPQPTAGGEPVACDTLAKLVHAARAAADGGPVPGWVDRIGPGSLVLVDEAGMAGTLDLATAIDFVVARGGSVRLVGDDRQLAAVGAGGLLRDLADTHGALTLGEVLRFTHPDSGAPNRAEAAASLALRDGDPAALAYYTDHRRIHVGTPTTTLDQAYTAWAADRAAGNDAVLLAPTRELAAQLNTRARRDRLDHDRPGQDKPDLTEVALADGSRASAGDTILTRRNNRRLALSGTDWVKNGDRWTVHAVHPSGGLDVVHHPSRRHLTLPAGYVAAHVQLGYATTVHGAQGITAGTCHTVATGQESRQLFYVALTRGRHANHLYLATASDGDPHTATHPETMAPPTAVEVLTRVLGRDGAATSATGDRRALADPVVLLGQGAERYRDALTVGAETLFGPAALARLDLTADTLHSGLTDVPAWPALRDRLVLYALDGYDPHDLLRAAVNAGPLEGARDIAAVLHGRLGEGRADAVGPLPWLPGIPAALAADPDWAGYLQSRVDLITGLAADLARQATPWTTTTAPPWATSLIGRDPALVSDLTIWRAAHRIPDTDRRPTGSPPQTADIGPDRHFQGELEQRVAAVLGRPTADTTCWQQLAASIEPRLADDPYWPTLASRLTALTDTAADIATLTRRAAAGPALPDEQPAAALWWRLTDHLSIPDAPRSPGRPSTSATPKTSGTCVAAGGPETAAHRWGALAASLHPALTEDVGWPALAASLDRAQVSGWDVTTELPRLAAHWPLPDQHIGRTLQLRLATACPAAMRTRTPAVRQHSPEDRDAPGAAQPLSVPFPVPPPGPYRGRTQIGRGR